MRRIDQFLFTLLLLLVAVGGLPSCHTDEPCPTCPPHPQNRQTIFLDTLLVDPTEVWLSVWATPIDSSSLRKGGVTESTLVRVYRDSTVIVSRFISERETLRVVDAPLLPSQLYQYRAYRLSGGTSGTPIDSTAGLTVRTMDTTSHDFTFQLDTLGDGAGSVLYDVAIINDTLAYAVGEIYQRDSTGQWDTEPYSIAIWNGGSWRLQRIYPRYPGYQYPPPVRARGIFAFSATDVWLADGTVWHWDGVSDTTAWRTGPFPSPDAGAHKLWGTSSQNLYAIGQSGLIAHYDGRVWRKLESGTDVSLLDVYGSPDGSVVWACGYYTNRRGTYLLRSRARGPWEIAYDGTLTQGRVLPDTLSGSMGSIYTHSTNRVFVASGAGLYVALSATRGEASRNSFTPSDFPGLPNRIRGEGPNDLFIAGFFTFIAHYNGAGWRYFHELRNTQNDLTSVAQKDGFVVAVGYIYHPVHRRGLVLRGRR